MEYVDQYLIHWPVSMKPGPNRAPNPDAMLPLDIKAVWTEMEECQTLGLTKSIGVSNFTCKKLAHLLSFAKIPPAVNQVSFYLVPAVRYQNMIDENVLYVCRWR